MMEMMMFQNAQVHQMIMQQMMLSAIPKQTHNEQQMLNQVVDKLTVSCTFVMTYKYYIIQYYSIIISSVHFSVPATDIR